MKDLLKERGRGEEADYFRKQDAKLLEKMRERARLGEIATALAAKLRIDDAELLHRVGELGLTQDTGAAILLAPLVQVAWAEGKVTDKERETVLRLAASRGIEKGSPAEAQLLAWLDHRPSDAVFQTAIEVIKSGLSHLSPQEREQRIASIVDACREVSEASGGIAKSLGFGSGVSSEERSALDVVTKALRSE